MQPDISVGKYTGTGSTIAINLGFCPDFVHIVNSTAKDRAVEAFRGDTTGTGILFETVVQAIAASGGVTFQTGGTFGDPAATVGSGFQIDNSGVGVLLSVSGQVYKYFACRSGAGNQNLLGN